MSSFSDRLRDLSPVWNEKSSGEDDLDSLPSMSTSDIYSDADSEAQEEWERSLEQLQLLLTMMVIPFVGKYFGRKFAYWSTSGTCVQMESIANRGCRLGQIHGVASRRRSALYEQEGLQGHRCRRSGLQPVIK